MIDPDDQTAAALARAVDGEFRLEREIGRGGMGVVYLATDLQLERSVAIKTLPPHLAANADIRSRFVREARTAAALSHPNIVPIHHAAERDGVVYFAMGWVPGESLAERVARAGPVPIEELVPMLIELSDALGYAHSRGVVHRDVKAENALIDSRTGRVMVTDFGIARVTEAQPLTATGTTLGTVHYMSPEQVIGERLDGRSDLYALGVLAFYAATGRYPFERATAPAVLVAHVNSAPPRLHEYQPGAPDWMDGLIATLLEKRPDDRFATAEALSDALRDGSGAPRSRPSHPPAGQGITAAIGAESKLSSEDAREIWARAAQLQANTGVVTPPPKFALRMPTDPDSATRGYDAALVRASAEEAGIPAVYVDRALAERAGVAAVMVTPGESMAKAPNFFLGSRTRIELQSSIEGELTDEGFEEIADEVRRALGELVTVSAVGRTLSVTSTATVGHGQGRRQRVLQVHITSRAGITKVHAFEGLQHVAGLTFGVGMGAIGSGAGAMIMGTIMATLHNPVIGLSAWAALVATSYVGARLVYGRLTQKHERDLRALVERVTVCAQKHAVRRIK